MARIRITIPMDSDWTADDELVVYIGDEGAADLNNSTPSGGKEVAAFAAIPDGVVPIERVLDHEYFPDDVCATLPVGVAVRDAAGNVSAIVEGLVQLKDPPRGVRDLATAAPANPNEVQLTWTASPDV